MISLGEVLSRISRRGSMRLLKAVCQPGRQVAMFELPIPPLYEGFGRVQRKLASRCMAWP